METTANGYTPNLNKGATEKYSEMFNITDEREESLKNEMSGILKKLMDDGRGEDGIGQMSSDKIVTGFLDLAKNENEALFLSMHAGMKIIEFKHQQEEILGLFGGELLGKLVKSGK